MRRFNSKVATGVAASALQLKKRPTAAPQQLSSSAVSSASAVMCESLRHLRIVTLGVDTPEEIAARKAAEAAEKKRLQQTNGGKYLSKPDAMLTSFPEGVGKCTVFRNVMSYDEEQLIWEELTPVMKQDGTLHFAEASKVDDKKLRNIYLELYGMKPYTDVKNWKKQETKQVPGFVWTPTLVKWLQRVGPEIEAFLNKDGRLTPATPTHLDKIAKGLAEEEKGKGNGKKDDVVVGPVDWLDMGRVVEHNDPGYEMHTEHPTTGRYFIYLNLLSETVLTFDDEASGRVGHVLLPQRSLMICSSELRWGWRNGEHSSKTQTYTKDTSVVNADGVVQPSVFKKTVTPDIRLSIQMWKYDVKLADRRHLQSLVENSVRDSMGGGGLTSYDGSDDGAEGGGGSSSSLLGGDGAGSTGAFKINAFSLGGDGVGNSSNGNATQIKRGGGGGGSKALDMTAATAPKIDDASNNTVGLGKLGGDLISQAERDAAAKNAKQSSSSSSSSSNSDDASTNTTAPAVPKTMAEVDRDFHKYKDSFSRLTGLMTDMKAREDAGMKVSDEWLKEKMEFSKEGDEYGFDPVNPERTWEQIENKARFYRDRIRSMDYDGTNNIGGASPQKKGGGASAGDRNSPETQRAARDTMDAELIIDGIETEWEDPVQAQKRADDDVEGDGVVGGRFEGFGSPNRSPADMRAMMEKLMPKSKADKMLNSMPSSFSSGAGMGMGGTGGKLFGNGAGGANGGR